MINVTVTTAAPLPADLKGKVEEFIEKKAGKDTETEYFTDETLLAGIVIKIGDVVYDGSAKKQIERLKQNF